MSAIQTLNLETPRSKSGAGPQENGCRKPATITVEAIENVLGLINLWSDDFHVCGIGPSSEVAVGLRKKLEEMKQPGSKDGNLTIEPIPGSTLKATVPAGTSVIGTSLVFGERRDVHYGIRG